MLQVSRISLTMLFAFALYGCASASGPATENEADPVVHEYRTGSLIAQKEKHVTTDEERQQAQDAAEAIRAGARFDPTRK